MAIKRDGSPRCHLEGAGEQGLDLNQWFPRYERDEDGQTPLPCHLKTGAPCWIKQALTAGLRPCWRYTNSAYKVDQSKILPHCHGDLVGTKPVWACWVHASYSDRKCLKDQLTIDDYTRKNWIVNRKSGGPCRTWTDTQEIMSFLL